MTFALCGETGTRTRGPETRPQLSRLLHYHSATSPECSPSVKGLQI